MENQQGYIYIIHLERKMSNTQHYIGWALNVAGRLWHHRKGSGSRYLAAANLQGIQYSIVADYPGTRALERMMKNQRNHKQYCPICMAGKHKDPTQQKQRVRKKGKGQLPISFPVQEQPINELSI